MELDLNLFLQTTTDEDDDEDDDRDLRSLPHRTVDDILNDSDSSSSSSSPRRSGSKKQDSLASNDDLVSVFSNPNFSSDTSMSIPISTVDVISKPSLFSRGKYGEFSGDSYLLGRKAVTRQQLPALFGSVRSNAKPGAALAAAAAASRSIPTPHAAAIKSRRAGIASLQKVLDNEELLSSSSADQANIIVSDVLTGMDSVVSDLEQKLVEEDEEFDDFQSANLDTGEKSGDGEVEEMEMLAEHVSEVSVSSVENSEEVILDLNFKENVTVSHSNGTKDDNLVNTSADANSATLNATSSAEIVVPSASSEFDKDLKPGENFDDGTVERENQGVVLANESDDDTSMKDVNELVEDMIAELESKMESKKVEKKSRPPSMKPLELAEQLEMKYASTGLHWEEGAAAQPMRLEGVRRGSITLGYFDIDSNNTITRTISSQPFKRDNGSSQVLAVNHSYIAVGMSKGVIMVVPSKYSSQNVDNMDSKMFMLGLQGDRSHAAVTSMCFNQQGDLLLAGYGDGHITIWDLQRAAPAKVITGEHSAPVVHTFFLGQDSQVTRNFKAVTGDSKGLVLLHSFSVVPLLNRFSNKTQCLLDGQRTGTVLAASPLLYDEVLGGYSMSSTGNATVSTSSIGSMMGGVVGGDTGWKLFAEGSTLVEEGVVIFVTNQTALVVRLSPNLEVYTQFSRPDGVREGSMPCTAWKYMVQPQNMPAEPPEKVSLLAVAWDRKVQVAKLVKSELKIYGKWTLDSAAIGVAWLDDQMLVVLTVTGQLCLFAKDGTVIHQTSFAVDGSGGNDLVAYHTHFTNIFGNPEKAYNNCLAVRGATIYILGPSHLIVSRLLPWKERIQVLRKAGDWMGSLNMAMTLYDGHSHGVIDLPRSLNDVHKAIMPYLVELLLSYVDEVFSYISVAFCNQIGKMEPADDPKDKSTSVKSEIKEQFTRVGGVAVEFCVHIKRTDILFDEIFSKFVSVQHKDTFFELLEPYILRDMLGFLPPEIMQGLVEHYSGKGWLQRVEQCVLHMDISSLDFNQVVRLCREHGLYGALVYLFNRGLDDYRAPLEELLIVLQNSQRESAAVIGYRMLVYLKYCFSGLAFPPGHGEISATRLPSLRLELMRFLLEESNSLISQKAVKSPSTTRVYSNLYHLLELDTEATLDVLRCAFVENDILNSNSLEHELNDSDMEAKKEMNSSAESKKLLVQQTVDALINILHMDILPKEETAGNDDVPNGEVWPSTKDIGHLFEFIAYYVACERACVSKSVLSNILEYLTSDNTLPSNAFPSNIGSSNRREKQVLALLEVVPQTDWNSSFVLELCERVKFHQVCGLIHTIRRQHLTALDSYMMDVDEPIHAFAFINNTLCKLIDAELAAFRSAIISRIPELVNLSREGTFLLLMEDFNKESPHIISELQSHPNSLFLYLKTVIEVHLSGNLNFSSLIKDDSVTVHCGRRLKDRSCEIEAYIQRIADFPKLIRNNPVLVTDNMVELYFELLCKYERNLVLKFLETFENYRVEHCLRLCQEYGIIDAAAFLLERVGDVGSALLLTLSGINDKFIMLDTAVENVLGNDKHIVFDTVLRMKEVNDVRDMLHACIGLCQRNTPRLDPEESESLWFRLLDSFCEPLIDSDDSKISAKGNHDGTLAKSFIIQEDEGGCTNMWKISKSRGGFQILRRLFSQFIKEIVEGMIGYLRLPTIMSKLLSDNGGQEFGDFKLTILGMLGTYGFERRILGTAKSLIEDDTFYTMSLLKKGASHGYAPRSLTCCICNCLLTKSSSSSSIRVFSCGHATHIQCEFVESEALKRGSSSGCPLCMPKKKTQKARSKSSLTENGLFSKSLTKRPQGPGTTISHPHESDPFESLFGPQQISRFEILTTLQKHQGLIQIENMPQLRLAPPAFYHEKVKKGTDFLNGESSSSSSLAKVEKPNKSRKLRDLKVKGSSIRFPLKSSIFGKEKMSSQ